ncbi:MAG: Hint domain-containing protein [Pseudomonadota bacterium]
MTFFLISPSAINDPDAALEASPGGESNSGDAAPGDTLSFDAAGDTLITIDDDVLTDDPASDLVDPVTIDGVLYPAGANVESDYSFITFNAATGLYHRISHVTINNEFVGATISQGFDVATDDFAPTGEQKYPAGDELVIVDPDDISDEPGWENFVFEANYNLGPGQAYDNDVDVSESNGVVICFGEGAMISLADGGARAVEDLKVGDLVATDGGGPKAIRWIGRRRVSAMELRRHPALRPIAIAPGALGESTPSRQLIVSPQHRMLIRGPVVSRMFGVESCLAPAKRLLSLPGVTCVEADQPVVYFHLLLDGHHVVYANDAPAESLSLGVEAKKALSDEALDEIALLFPQALSSGSAPELARLVPSGRRTERLLTRLTKNKKPLLDQRRAS